MEPRAGAVLTPPVVVVVVSRDPVVDRFDALLRALADQDYPNFRVLVIDAGSREDATARVADVLPDARVLRLDDDDGYGASANRVLDFVEGAELYVFSHDDVAPEPDALSALVEVAIGYEAGIVGPKLVAWDDPNHLLQVGMASDRIGTALPFVEPGELDQAQHDGLREVFVVPGAFTLVRADLFERIGGFDESVTLLGDDVSLSWRARVAGASVLVTSDATVRHAQALAERCDRRERTRLADRHRLRALLMCTGVPRLVLVLPQAVLVTLGQVVAGLATGRAGRAADAVGAWVWNLQRIRSLLAARRHVASIRRVPDRHIAKAQVRGIIGPRLQLRRLGGEARLAASRPGAHEDDPPAWSPATAFVWVALVAVLAFGSRHLLTRGVPAIGELVPFDDDPGALLAEWASGWRTTGLGSARAAPTAVGVLGILTTLAGGATGLLRTVLTLGMIPLGIVGAHRLLRPAGSRRVQVAAAVAYAAVPLPYNALGAGRWTGLVAYAGAPWLIGRLARAMGAAPFTPGVAGAPGVGSCAPAPWSARQHVVAVGAATALVGLLVPAAPVLLGVVAVGLLLGSVLAADTAGVRRLLAVALGGLVVALALHLPTTLGLLQAPGRIGAWLGVDHRGDGLAALDLLRFDTGALGAAPLGFALVVAAVLPLLVGRSWRLTWSARAWGVAVVAWGLALAAEQGWTGVPLPPTDVLLAPAAAALALAVGLGVAALDADVAGRSSRFGFRRTVSGIAVVALVAAVVPVVAAALDGWWKAPRGDYAGVLGFVEGDLDEVPSRVLWLGDPEVLPGGPGWAWRDDVTYATSLTGLRGVRDLWSGDAAGATPRIAEALDLAVGHRTTRLGRLLGPMGVRYVAVPQRLAPSPYSDEVRPVPAEVTDALGAQLDLEEVRVDEALVLYRNTAFAPVRSLLSDDDGLDVTSVAGVQGVDLTGAFPVLIDRRGQGAAGTLPPEQTLYDATTASERWRLEVGGEVQERATAFGWANAYRTGGGGEAELSYRTSPAYRLVLAVQVGLWALALVVVLRMRFGGEPPTPSLRTRPGAERSPDAHGGRPGRLESPTVGSGAEGPGALGGPAVGPGGDAPPSEAADPELVPTTRSGRPA
ncbi:MAG TPA: glycosyltransferase family 2 protein [Acidimicrobiales bacterium]|nr:glycosyltransferase family 2 protein [Acidimicrobiales bacterium]